MFLVFFNLKKILLTWKPRRCKSWKKQVISAGQVKLIWPEICPNTFKMPIKSISMQNKYTLSWYKPWLFVFKQFSWKHFSGMPDWNVLYTSECVIICWTIWKSGFWQINFEWMINWKFINLSVSEHDI